MEAFIIKKQIHLGATPAEVWDALTNPDKTRHYFFGCQVVSNWEKGSSITFKRKFLFFFNFELKGTILEIKPGKLLKYTLKNSKSNSESIVTDEIKAEKGATVLFITDDVGQGEGAEKRYRRSVRGWDKILSGLRKFLDK